MKESLMKTINPFDFNTDDTGSKMLAHFLMAHPNTQLLKKGYHSFKDEEGKTVEFNLTHHLIKRKRFNKKNIEGERYEVLLPKPIGNGGFGTIYPCLTFEIKEDKFVFIKNIKPRLVKLMLELEKIEVDKYSDDFHIGQYFDYLRVKPPVTDDKTYLAITMRELEHPNLADFLEVDRENLTADDFLDITLAITHACKGMKKLGVIHSDFKPANLLIGLPETEKNYFNILPIDFQFSQFEKNDKENLRTLGGTLLFQSPETRHQKIINRQTELYSLGVVLYLLFFPANETQLEECLQAQFKKNQPFIDAFDFTWPKNGLFNKLHQQLIVELIKNLLSENPKKRPNLKAINNIIKNIQYDRKYPQKEASAETSSTEPSSSNEDYTSESETHEKIAPRISNMSSSFFNKNSSSDIQPEALGVRQRAQSY